MFHIVLVHPEIPHNAGAAGRLALATGSALHLVKPLGFSIDAKSVRRAGLDYWKEVDLHVHESWEDFLASTERVDGEVRFWYGTTKTKRAHWDVEFKDGDYLLFGAETTGLPEPLIRAQAARCLRIPMREGSTRSLNLSTSVAIVLYEALRQCGVEDF